MTPIGGLGTPIDGTILLAREQTIRSRNNCLNTGKSKSVQILVGQYLQCMRYIDGDSFYGE